MINFKVLSGYERSTYEYYLPYVVVIPEEDYEDIEEKNKYKSIIIKVKDKCQRLTKEEIKY